MKKATAYKRNDQIILHSLSKTTADIWILSEPVLTQNSLDCAIVGQSVILAVNGSLDNVAHPTAWKGHFDLVLQLAGVKNLPSFMNNCLCVEIETAAGVLFFQPTQNRGAKIGFKSLGDKVGPIELSELGKVGKALRIAFNLSE